MKNIFTKIFLSFLVVILVFTVTTIYFSFDIIRNNEQNALIRNLVNQDRALIFYITPLLKENNKSNLDSLIKSLGKDVDTRLTIINPQGVVLADSKADIKSMDNHGTRPEVMQAVSEDMGSSLRHSYTLGKDLLYVALPIKTGDKLIGISRVSLYMDSVDILINSFLMGILKIIAIIVLISLIIAFIFSRTITKPIKQLAMNALLISEGNFDIKMKVKNKDEVKLLADSFNNMVERIKTLFIKTNQQKEELNNIITSIQESLVVLDNQSKIILTNNSFNKMVRNENANGKFIWEVLRDAQFDKFMKKLHDVEANPVTEIFYNDEYYLCSANHINMQNEIVIIFYKITEFKKLENIKKDFVINVSHELRTPLTVIKGYVETIEDESGVNNRKYLDIIKNHTNRLINIVQDLLTISQLEEKNVKLDFTEIQLSKFFNELENTFDQKLKQKNLTLKINLPDSLSSFNADEFKLQQMFINLIDNAMKYTESGGITINVFRENAHIRFEVIDTGLGIPEKDKERVFERFYTVDKSRSRQMAGTGLGLSIVKHIVLMHGGKISVESKPGDGSKFIIMMPIINQ